MGQKRMEILKKWPKTLSTPKCKKLKIFSIAALPKGHGELHFLV
jgi:hypothetical protein